VWSSREGAGGLSTPHPHHIAGIALVGVNDVSGQAAAGLYIHSKTVVRHKKYRKDAGRGFSLAM